MSSTRLAAGVVTTLLVSCQCFAPISVVQRLGSKGRQTVVSATTYSPIFDFSAKDQHAVDKFERIDDVIMGGISSSTLKDNAEEGFAKWSGICRSDGGGFCGTRTLPFVEPIEVKGAEGLYISCRLTSDDEPERRVWKLTTRTEQSRGEQLYQAMLSLPKTQEGTWNTVEVPFSSFVQVRGPRIVDNAESLNKTNGLFQIGLSLSKFVISKNTTEIENFRPGFFEMQVKEIGIYNSKGQPMNVVSPTTLSKQEIEKKKPILLKILRPVLSFFFNEERRRRKSALNILRKRGMTTTQALVLGFRMRAKRKGLLGAVAQSVWILCQDTFCFIAAFVSRVTLVFPVRLFSRLMKTAKRPRTTKT